MNTDDANIEQVLLPDERLTDVVRHIYCIRQSAQAPTIQKQLVPNYEMMLIVNFGPAITASAADYTWVVERSAVLGPLNKLLRYTVPPDADMMVVVFTLNGFYRLVGQPVHSLRSEADADIGMRLNDETFAELWAQLKAMPSLADRLDLLNAYLLLHMAPADEDARSILEGVVLFDNVAIDPVKVIAETRQLSTRSVQLRFQTNLGVSAKELARFLRFKKMVTELITQYPAPPDWANLVFVHGYHDQSHLIRDFQQFMGLSPTEFLQQLASQEICISQPGKYY
ncbi:helix-turn-helix domain-containing protein [Spirosoma oryzicola]|uniref:helix-turn-helix domain-containing protein n=1 Tax=Spirosoma oryzicola TaxID=2898794 RepID=UPI001E316E28|nr:helix-turn-helix domain-containing protein [Spirosoma oryzicola]UHG94300.1 helix-turn-helix domain-containing protein [Spirosoma oryzicola]